METICSPLEILSCSEGLKYKQDFNAWNDYLGLSALIRGLQHSGVRGESHLYRPLVEFPPKKPVMTEMQGCGFCRNNREAAEIYSNHRLKGTDGRILCPILRCYTCPLCGANGDNAHTLRYCPMKLSVAGMRRWNGLQDLCGWNNLGPSVTLIKSKNEQTVQKCFLNKKM
ncbi:nanos homolog 1 [Pelobates fuscus]|uniref:nanos homolog 1 n=1 Tax=Pelobates fuscus TaxID=191477 RepID=UPI002FE4EE23